MIYKAKFIHLVFFVIFFLSLSEIFKIPNIFIYYIISLNIFVYFLVMIFYQNFITRQLIIKTKNIQASIEVYDNIRKSYMKLNNSIENSIEKLYKVSFSQEFLEKQIAINKLNNEVFFLENSFATFKFLTAIEKAENNLFKTLSNSING